MTTIKQWTLDNISNAIQNGYMDDLFQEPRVVAQDMFDCSLDGETEREFLLELGHRVDDQAMDDILSAIEEVVRGWQAENT